MNQRNDTSRAMTQKQREAIMRLLPSTVGKMATALGLPTRSVWKRLKTLEEQKAAPVMAAAKSQPSRQASLF